MATPLSFKGREIKAAFRVPQRKGMTPLQVTQHLGLPVKPTLRQAAPPARVVPEHGAIPARDELVRHTRARLLSEDIVRTKHTGYGETTPAAATSLEKSTAKFCPAHLEAYGADHAGVKAAVLDLMRLNSEKDLDHTAFRLADIISQQSFESVFLYKGLALSGLIPTEELRDDLLHLLKYAKQGSRLEHDVSHVIGFFCKQQEVAIDFDALPENPTEDELEQAWQAKNPSDIIATEDLEEMWQRVSQKLDEVVHPSIRVNYAAGIAEHIIQMAIDGYDVSLAAPAFILAISMTIHLYLDGLSHGKKMAASLDLIRELSREIASFKIERIRRDHPEQFRNTDLVLRELHTLSRVCHEAYASTGEERELFKWIGASAMVLIDRFNALEPQ